MQQKWRCSKRRYRVNSDMRLCVPQVADENRADREVALCKGRKGAQSLGANYRNSCRERRTALVLGAAARALHRAAAGACRAGCPPGLSQECEGIMNAPRPSHVTRAFLQALVRIRLWSGTFGGVLRSGLAVLLVCAALAPAARAFEWCPNDYGPDAYCLDGYACCPYPYGPGYWC